MVFTIVGVGCKISMFLVIEPVAVTNVIGCTPNLLPSLSSKGIVKINALSELWLGLKLTSILLSRVIFFNPDNP